jgi:hypothetical protein
MTRQSFSEGSEKTVCSTAEKAVSVMRGKAGALSGEEGGQEVKLFLSFSAAAIRRQIFLFFTLAFQYFAEYINCNDLI